MGKESKEVNKFIENTMSIGVAAQILGYNIDFMIQICRRAHISGRPFIVLRSNEGKYLIEKSSFERYINTCPDYCFDGSEYSDLDSRLLNEELLDFVCGSKQDANAATASRYEVGEEIHFTKEEQSLLEQKETGYVSLTSARYMLHTDIPTLVLVCERAYTSQRPFKVIIDDKDSPKPRFLIEKSSLLHYIRTCSAEFKFFIWNHEEEGSVLDHVCGCIDLYDAEVDEHFIDSVIYEDTYEGEPIIIPKEYEQYLAEVQMKEQQSDATNKLFAEMRGLRIALGLTQEELAKKAGIGQTDLSKLERGLTKNPSIETIQKVANALGFVLKYTYDLNIYSME